jgi:hypothetical protein
MKFKPTMNIVITRNPSPSDESEERNYELKIPLGVPLGEVYDVVYEILQFVAREIPKSANTVPQNTPGMVVNPSDPADAGAGSTNAS